MANSIDWTQPVQMLSAGEWRDVVRISQCWALLVSGQPTEFCESGDMVTHNGFEVRNTPHAKPINWFRSLFANIDGESVRVMWWKTLPNSDIAFGVEGRRATYIHNKTSQIELFNAD